MASAFLHSAKLKEELNPVIEKLINTDEVNYEADYWKILVNSINYMLLGNAENGPWCFEQVDKFSSVWQTFGNNSKNEYKYRWSKIRSDWVTFWKGKSHFNSLAPHCNQNQFLCRLLKNQCYHEKLRKFIELWY